MIREVKLQLRLPEKVRNWLKEESKEHDRSMNGQMVAILKEKMQANDKHQTSAPG